MVCVNDCLSVCVLVTTVSFAKTAEPTIELPFGMDLRDLVSRVDWSIPHAKGKFCGNDVGIFEHAVDLRSHWSVAVAVVCYSKFSRRVVRTVLQILSFVLHT